MEPQEGHYVELRTKDVPIGWSNHPDLLRVTTDFAHHRVNETLHPSLYFSRPRPILTDTQSIYIFEEQGRGYYVWNDISGGVAEIKENSWDVIIAKLNEGGLFSLILSPLRTVDDPSREPTSNIPYLPNSDFIDRPYLTENFQIPLQRSVLLYGSEGRRKSELAIQYASKVRTQSPETWVFWLCATTTEKFDEDMAAIADILPEGPPTNQELSRKDFVLDWLRTQYPERWLLVVDDFTSDKVNLLLENEALQLLQRKLKQPLTDADGHNLVTGAEWTPLAVELVAASLNPRSISMSQFIAAIKSRKTSPLTVAFEHLFQSLNPYEQNLLYFISFFNPPEVPRLWIRSYLEWKGDETESDELENSLERLTKSSLLLEILGRMTAYKMQTAVRHHVVTMLAMKNERGRLHRDIKSFVDLENWIPNHTLLSIGGTV